MFGPEITEQLGFYVYRLIDPRNGQTFYVGKGEGNRVFEHASSKLDTNGSKNSDNLKNKTIREIMNAGLEVCHVIHRHGMDEDTALEVEAALIDAYPEVVNIQSGHDSAARGVMHVQELIERHQAEEIVVKHALLMINVNRSSTRENNIYEAVRYSWKLDLEKAKRARFVLAMQQGLVIGVFELEQWLDATEENFSGKGNSPGRKGFIGREAPDHIQKMYMRKRLPDKMRRKGAANPVRYANP